nr:ribonuclease H-like domain-containing protein [Tanacetum cinerariifolium]
TDGKAMINSIQNGDQTLHVIAQVSLAGNAQNAPPTLKDLKFWTAEEKKTRKIDRLSNDIYSLIDSNETAKDLWDAHERQMRGSEYGEQDKKAVILYEYKTFKAIEGEQLLDTYLRYLQVINDLKKCGYKKDNYPLALVAEKTKVSKRKEKVVVSLDFEGSGRTLCQRLQESKGQRQQLLSSSDSDQEINANMVFMAQIEKVLLDLDESSSSAEETIAEVAYYTSESEYETSEYYDNSTNYGLFVNNDDDQEIFHDAIESARENFIENHIDSQNDYDKFENPSYFEKVKDLRPSLYDKKVIGRGYTPMFLIHSDEALEIKKFKRASENKIEFAYDYRNLNASYVNEKIKFSDDYFQEIINPHFEKIDSSFQQTSSLKPYVSNVILEKIIIDLEDEVVSLLEKEKVNLKTIESLKSKVFESSENAISESENQSEKDCLVLEKECDQVENSKVIAPGMFKLSVSQSVSPISMSKTYCDSKNVENKLKRKRLLEDLSIAVLFGRRKGSSNTFNVDLSSVSHLKLNKNVKRYSRKDSLSCNNSHLGVTSSAYVCNDAMNVSCNSRMCDLFDENNLFIFDYESVRISPVSKMPFRKQPYCPDLSLDHQFGMFKAYYGHNLFSVGQFHDKGLEVAFQKSTCFVRNKDGVDLLT